MDNMLKYKNFAASVRYSEEDAVFVGHITGIQSVVSFEGENENELQTAFKEAVESYLDFCKRKGIEAYQKPYTNFSDVGYNFDRHRKSNLALCD